MLKIEVAEGVMLDDAPIMKRAQIDHIRASNDILKQTEDICNEKISHLQVQILEAQRNAYVDAYIEALNMLWDASEEYNNSINQLEQRFQVILQRVVQNLLTAVDADALIKASLGPVIDELKKEAEITVTCAPGKDADIREAFGALLAPQHQGNLLVEVDPQLLESECKIFTASEIIDLNITLQTEALVQAVLSQGDIDFDQ